MLNEPSLQAVAEARWGERFMRPLYETYGFALLPRLVRALFGQPPDAALAERLLGPLAGQYETVILVLVDGFGWRFLEQYGERYPFLRRFVHEGVVTKLTSQFPSTTAAHMTTLHGGLEVGQHGVYEWFFYEPSADAVIAPLLFSYAGDRERNRLAADGVTPGQVFPRGRLYRELAEAGVSAYLVQDREFTPSPFSDVVCAGARMVPCASVADGARLLVDGVLSERGRGYYYLYVDSIDAAGHFQGIDSPRFAEEVDACFTALEAVLHAGLVGRLTDALVLLAADHGLVEADRPATIYLDQTVPEIAGWLVTNRRGQPLVPAGSARDLFLHVRPEHLSDARDLLREHLRGRAEAYPLRELVQRGFFGSEPPSETFLARAGNLVVLPYRDDAVWWHGDGRFAQRYKALHGGLSAEEMETILLALPYG